MMIDVWLLSNSCAFSAVALLVGCQEGHRTPTQSVVVSSAFISGVT